MDESERQRTAYVSRKQKKKLINLMTKHPELVSSKPTRRSNHTDLQKLWQNIASECNSIPGARKTWRQWRKTWQDLKSKYKKRHSDELPPSIQMLTQAEKDILGVQTTTSTSDCSQPQVPTEFVPIGQEGNEDFNDETVSNGSYSEPESLPEEKVFTDTVTKVELIKSVLDSKSEHSRNCVFNCDKLTALEQKKMQLKEDYFKFKKDYLQQKLVLLKEQSEALQCIAKNLSK